MLGVVEQGRHNVPRNLECNILAERCRGISDEVERDVLGAGSHRSERQEIPAGHADGLWRCWSHVPPVGHPVVYRVHRRWLDRQVVDLGLQDARPDLQDSQRRTEALQGVVRAHVVPRLRVLGEHGGEHAPGKCPGRIVGNAQLHGAAGHEGVGITDSGQDVELAAVLRRRDELEIKRRRHARGIPQRAGRVERPGVGEAVSLDLVGALDDAPLRRRLVLPINPVNLDDGVGQCDTALRSAGEWRGLVIGDDHARVAQDLFAALIERGGCLCDRELLGVNEGRLRPAVFEKLVPDLGQDVGIEDGVGAGRGGGREVVPGGRGGGLKLRGRPPEAREYLELADGLAQVGHQLWDAPEVGGRHNP